VKSKDRENIKFCLILIWILQIDFFLLFILSLSYGVKEVLFVWRNIFFADRGRGMTGGGVLHGISCATWSIITKNMLIAAPCNILRD
jgi:hypothetical protein